MALPIPGKPVRGSKSGQPIMALFDLLGRSWAMGIIWNLANGACTFRQLQAHCETVSPTTLNLRIKELTDSFIIERTIDGYALTKFGEKLFALLEPMGKLAKEWTKKF
jgi:DNA-binding HxlR family transcriptional regulator